MKYQKLTIDWDYYMLNMITKHKLAVLELFKKTCNTIQILDTQKGLNIIADFKQPVDFFTLMFARLHCFDDIFRIRNEIDKHLDGQDHRINRIWLVKNDIEKTVLFEGETKNLDIEMLNGFIEIIKSKRPVKEAKK